MDFIKTYLEETMQAKSESTLKNHRSTLTKFFKSVDANEPAEVLMKDVMKFKKALLSTGTVASANTQLKRVKAFFNWCVDKGIIADSPAEQIVYTAAEEETPKWLTSEQFDALVRAVNRDYLGIKVADEQKSYRELLMVLLMGKAGLRVGEVVGLKWKDVQLSERKGTVLVRGKADQQRKVPMVSDLLATFKAYEAKHGRKGDYVFYSRQSEQVTERTVQNILKKYQGMDTGKVTIEELTPHMLRHTFAHELAIQKTPLEAIARVMGHIKRNGKPNIQQTLRYTMTSEDEIADMLEDALGIN